MLTFYGLQQRIRSLAKYSTTYNHLQSKLTTLKNGLSNGYLMNDIGSYLDAALVPATNTMSNGLGMQYQRGNLL